MAKDGKDKELNLFEKQQIIAKHLQRINHPLLDHIPQGKFLKKQQFPYDIRLLGTLENHKPIIVNSYKEVSFTNRLAIERLVHMHLDGMIPYWHMSNQSVKEIVSYFLKEAEILQDDQIQTLAELSDDSLCFKKLDFDLLDMKDEPTPMFDEIMGRWENSDEFMKFVGMLISPGGLDQQKYVWVYGEKGAGKGCIMRVLHDVLGQSAETMSGDVFNGRWGLSMCVGKRLVSFDDEMDDQFIKCGKMMSHTGGGNSIIEFKNEPLFSLRLRFLPMIYSNYEPEITRGEHVRRLIFVKAKAANFTVLDTSYELRLKEEAPAWLGKCYWKFLNNPVFAQNDTYAEQLAQFNMDWADALINNKLVILDTPIAATTKADIREILRQNRYSRHQIKDFFDHLHSHYGIEEVFLKVNGKTARGYKTVKIKTY